MDITNDINFIIENWDKIPDNFKTQLNAGRWSGESDLSNIPGLPTEDHVVVLLLDRQKPSVEADYSFDEERITVSKTGKVIWGFDSGCSCPSPWHDSYPGCYSCSDSWKEFELNIAKFDHDALEEVIATINRIKETIRG